MDVFWTLPPVTRTLTASAVIISALAHGGIIPFEPLLFIPSRLLKLEVWRLVTAFLITGPQLGIILDPYFLYMYGSQLENGSARFSTPGDFFWYIICIGVMITALAGLYLGGMVFMSPLTLALAYTFAQDDPNRPSGFFILTFPAKFLPYALLFMTFVMAGPQAAKFQATGLVAAHAYEFFTRIWPQVGGGRRWINTPGFVRRAFGADVTTTRQRDYGTAFQPRAANAAPQPATGRSTAFGLQSDWGQRGPGRRLG